MVDHTPETNRVLDALADEDCRVILRVTHLPRTAPEISDECGIPLSTVYRKVDRLTELSLLETRVRVDADGRHPTQYERRIDGVLVRLGPGDDLGVSVYSTTETVDREDTGDARPRERRSPVGSGDGSLPLQVQFVDGEANAVVESDDGAGDTR